MRPVFKKINPVPQGWRCAHSAADNTPPCQDRPPPERWPTTDIAILTIPRPDLHYTLAGLLMTGVTGTIHLLAGRPESDYLAMYKHHERIRIMPLGVEEWQVIQNKPPGWLACHNYLRALSLSANNLVVVEDDVAFRDFWQAKMEAVVREIEDVGRYHAYYLSLYSPTMITTRTTRSYGHLPYRFFCGMQAFYYPRRVVEATREFFKSVLEYEGAEGEIKPDIVLNKLAEEQKTPIFTTKYSLVQHVGKQSSLASGWHDSPSFYLEGNTVV